MKWARRLRLVILLLLLSCSMNCSGRTRYVYKPTDEQIIFAPAGTKLTAWASSKPIVTDGPEGKVAASTLDLPYDAIIMSQGKFLKIFGEKVDGMDNR